MAFAIASSYRTFEKRKEFIKLWWPHGAAARGFVFVEKRLEFEENFDSFLKVVVSSNDWIRFPYTFERGLRSAVRIARICKELIQILDQESSLHNGDVRWIVLGDDDTFFFTENLIKTLAKYNWEQFYYIGGLSESMEQNSLNSFGMAFGGAGFALSYPLAKVLSKVLDLCLMRYGHLYGSDARIFACLLELGIELTHEPGFHQVDVRGSIFGLLTAHPLAPIVSLHHLEIVDPLFPGMNHTQALNHLLKASNVDQGRIFQQTVCYDRSNSRTISISWGYVVQIYEGDILLPDLLSLEKTFTPWRRKSDIASSFFMFNTRKSSRDPCKRPTIFFFESVLSSKQQTESTYKKHTSTTCQQGMNSMKNLQIVRVYSEKRDLNNEQLLARRRDCCEVLPVSDEMVMDISIRKCKDEELIAMTK